MMQEAAQQNRAEMAALIQTAAPAIAQRWQMADDKGAATLANIAGVDIEAGKVAWRVFVHIGFSRADVPSGQPEFRHGNVMIADVIKRAIEQSTEILATRRTPWRKRR
jgi:hypothetical protein